MNKYSAYPHRVPGGFGFWAMIRFCRDSHPTPVMDAGDKPKVFPTRGEAAEECLKHVVAFMNGRPTRREVRGWRQREAGQVRGGGEDIQAGQSYRDREEGRERMKANEKAARVEALAAIMKTPYYLVAMAERSFCRRLSNRDSPRERDDLIQGRQSDQDVDDPGQNSILPPEEYSDEIELEKTYEQPIKAPDNDE
jgi:hypothetical protein